MCVVQRSKEGKEPLYRWDVSSRPEVIRTYEVLEPWLGLVKRRQFAAVLGRLGPAEHALPPERNEQLAWAAGLFDGEGWVGLEKHQSHLGYFRAEAGITQASWDGVPEVLGRFYNIFNVGKIYGPYPARDGHAPVYRWKAHRREQIEDIVRELGELLGAVKRAQAARVFAVLALQHPLRRGNPAWGNRKTHCVNGHDYATARIRPYRPRSEGGVERRPSKQCLACVRDYARERRMLKELKSGD